MAAIKVKKSANTKKSESIDNPASNGQVGHFMVAVGAIVEHEESGKILVLKRAEVDFKAGIWETGYGRLKQGEDPETGLKREFKEETGLDISPQQLISSWHFNRGRTAAPENEVIGITFWAKTDNQEVRLSPEHSEFKWVSPEEALEIIEEKGVRRDIQAFLDAKDLRAEAEATGQKYHRALADYQNLVRRTQEEKAAQAKVAALGVIQHLLQPLEHLSLAANQLNDQGIKMVDSEFRRALSDYGLEEIEALGKKFDLERMEVVDREGEGETVVKVLKPGFTLNGQVIQHAKVVLG